MRGNNKNNCLSQKMFLIFFILVLFLLIALGFIASRQNQTIRILTIVFTCFLALIALSLLVLYCMQRNTRKSPLMVPNQSSSNPSVCFNNRQQNASIILTPNQRGWKADMSEQYEQPPPAYRTIFVETKLT